jgi:ABC-type glycerol-3-phosphate transport system permease component
MQIPTTIFPRTWFFGSYHKIFHDQFFPRYFLNTCITSTIITCVAVTVSALIGYVFAKFNFPFKTLCFYAILLNRLSSPFTTLSGSCMVSTRILGLCFQVSSALLECFS